MKYYQDLEHSNALLSKENRLLAEASRNSGLLAEEKKTYYFLK